MTWNPKKIENKDLITWPQTWCFLQLSSPWCDLDLGIKKTIVYLSPATSWSSQRLCNPFVRVGHTCHGPVLCLRPGPWTEQVWRNKHDKLCALACWTGPLDVEASERPISLNTRSQDQKTKNKTTKITKPKAKAKHIWTDEALPVQSMETIMCYSNGSSVFFSTSLSPAVGYRGRRD